MNKTQLLRSVILTSFAIASVVIGADTWCKRPGAYKLACGEGQWYYHYSTTFFGSMDHDSPQACTEIDEEKWACNTDPEDPFVWGFKYPQDYKVGWTCTNAQCL